MKAVKSLEELNREFLREHGPRIRERGDAQRLSTDATKSSISEASCNKNAEHHFNRRHIFSEKNGFIRSFIIIFAAVLICIIFLRLLGYSWFNVISDSMSSEIPKGSLILVKRAAPEEIQAGDIITYRRRDGITVTHKVVKIIENCGGSASRGFETKGTENDVSDSFIVLGENVVGVVEAQINGIGGFFAAIKPFLYFLMGGIVIYAAFVIIQKIQIRRCGA